jgi:hypothetical protein
LADRLFGPGAPPIRYDTIASARFEDGMEIP